MSLLTPHTHLLLLAKQTHPCPRQLAHDFQDKQPLLLTTLAGAFIFTADLCRAMTPLPPGLQIDFPRASSYGQSAVSSGQVELQFNLLIPIKGRHVILIEDLIDTGRTLHALMEKLKDAEPASITVVTLLKKNCPREIVVEPDYWALEVRGHACVWGFVHKGTCFVQCLLIISKLLFFSCEAQVCPHSLRTGSLSVLALIMQSATAACRALASCAPLSMEGPDHCCQRCFSSATR